MGIALATYGVFNYSAEKEVRLPPSLPVSFAWDVRGG